MILLQVLNLLVYMAMITVNFLAVNLPINGQTTGEVARQYPSLFLPAGFVFNIWHLIYLLLAGFVIYQAGGLPAGKLTRPGLVTSISIFFIISSLANMGWIFIWHHHKIDLALVTIVMLLLSLIIIYSRLGIGRVSVDTRDWLFTHLPFSIYLAWITISTVGNFSIYLVSINWDGWGLSQTFWTVVAVFCLAAVAFFFLLRYRDKAFVLTFAWVFTGVFYQRFFQGEPDHYIIGLAALIAALLLLTALVFLTKPKETTNI